jgi:hypothetical protein
VSQSTTDTLTSAKTYEQAASNQSTELKAVNLLDSLERLYPNGQLPANVAIQTDKGTSQKLAALHVATQNALDISIPISQAVSKSVSQQTFPANIKPVTRIQNTTLYGAYFFTIYDDERNAALANSPSWNHEGVSFWASLSAGDGLSPVHRFRNIQNGSYLYTIYDAERAEIAANYTSLFTYEGVAWYAQQTLSTGWAPLYRFRNLTNGTYLFSASEVEKNAILANYANIFTLEGVAYYVLQDGPAPTPLPPCMPAAIGSTGYSLVFKACNGTSATYYDKTECVRDNSTKLIWQGHTNIPSDLRNGATSFNNFDSTTALQKWPPGQPVSMPTQVDIDSITNTIGFANAMNAENLCGSSAWRLPTTTELLSLAKGGQFNKRYVDGDWFPNTAARNYWTSIASTEYASTAWAVTFYINGNTAGTTNRAIDPSAALGSYQVSARLVRSN